MGNRRSIAYFITKYAIFEIIFTLFVVVFAYVFINVLILKGILYPANYAENYLNNIESEFKDARRNVDNIPYFYDYEYFLNGEVIESTINPKYDKFLEEADKNGLSSDGNLIGGKFFKSYKYENRKLIVEYSITPIFRSKNLYKLINNFEVFYFFMIALIWSLGFIILVYKSIKIIKEDIDKISSTNNYIRKMELNYPKEDARFKEIDDVLNSLHILATDLKKSLKDQWNLEKRQKELVESVAHDIRTPLTLIKGNLELMKEDEFKIKEERIDDIEKGIDRLEKYINKLNDINSKYYTEKNIVDEDMISYRISLIEIICNNKQRFLEIERSDISNIKLNKEEISTALQNIMINAIEHSQNNTIIHVSFCDFHDFYKIVIKDEGEGFDEKNISILKNKYVTTKNKNSYQHGMGLYIVDNIMDRNNGELILENYKLNEKSGAKITLLFNK